MHKRFFRILATVGVSLAVAAAADAATIWDEAIDGDLSNAQATPTPVILAMGTNGLTGNLRSPSTPGDSQDWIAVTVPAGLQLNQYVHTAYASADATSFTGFQIGSPFVG